MISVQEFKKLRQANKKIAMVTCYDHWTAKVLGQTDVDCLLVGDSVAMVVHGFASTIHADIAMMELHTSAVARANITKPIVADLPFLAHRQGCKTLMHAVDRLMKAGAHAVKIEAAAGQEDVVKYVADSGVPVVGHLGLTPQYIHQMGGYKVQGKTTEGYQKIFNQALQLQDAGCTALVLECIPSNLAQDITTEVSIPTIGIGAGLNVDGQVLVLQDLLGFNFDFSPRFVRQFAQGENWLKDAVNGYTRAVTQQEFPTPQESFL